MRIAVLGASAMGLDLVRTLIPKGHEVILVESDPDRAREIAESYDCAVIHGEPTQPDILEKARLGEAHAVVAATDHDQENILIAMIARTMGAGDVYIRTEDMAFLTIARKLGFHHVVNPAQTAATIIYDALRGIDTIELSTLLRGDVRIFSVIAGRKQAKTALKEVSLPDRTMCMGLYRNNVFHLSQENPQVQEGDELLFVAIGDTEAGVEAVFVDEEEAQPSP